MPLPTREAAKNIKLDGNSFKLDEYEGIIYIRKRKVKKPPEPCKLKDISATGQGLLQASKDRGVWAPTMKFIKFVLHFGIVVGVLFCGAWVFANFEDPLPDPEHNATQATMNNNITMSPLWENLEKKYNMKLNLSQRKTLLDKMRPIISDLETRKAEIKDMVLRRDREYIWMKWFYFTTITTTTIGFGDVVPQTQDGRLFYIFFSIFGIATMMTLLQSCGAILSAANTKFYSLMSRYICGETDLISQELLSVFSITIIFIGFMVAGIWYDVNRVRPGIEWSYIDVIYFWLYTFTTVGFGTPIDLKVELKHVYPLFVYRLFGLSFLAGIIDALVVYVEYRQELFNRQRKLSSLMSGSDKLDDRYSNQSTPLSSSECSSTPIVQDNDIYEFTRIRGAGNDTSMDYKASHRL